MKKLNNCLFEVSKLFNLSPLAWEQTPWAVCNNETHNLYAAAIASSRDENVTSFFFGRHVSNDYRLLPLVVKYLWRDATIP